MIIVNEEDLAYILRKETGNDSGSQQNIQTHNKSSTSTSKADVSPAPGTRAQCHIYKENIDMSKIPYFFVSEDSDDDEAPGFYHFPEDDRELLSCLRGPAPRYCNGRLKRSVVYCVEVEADSCTTKDCLTLLKAIDCEKQFISCSVEKARRFLAKLHKDEAARLKGLNGIQGVFPYSNVYYDH